MKSTKPVSERKLKANVQAISPKKLGKIAAFIPLLLEITVRQPSKH